MSQRRHVLRFSNLPSDIRQRDILAIVLSFGKVKGVRISKGQALVLFENNSSTSDALDILGEHHALVQRRLGVETTIDTFYHTRSKKRSAK